ncbi:MAG: DUF3883 domain-containing protein [Verrucomicrobiaceae bacterium]|nr:DUF3883 domain-containing protein [Verrucomicrobiaceae bacterium]
MVLNPSQIDAREKQILAGLFLSKFDAEGLNALGFESFTEAFNALGYGLGGRAASIKNYRDEFDPLFPNPRQGWRNRKRRGYCIEVEEKYRSLGLADFAALVAEFVGESHQPTPTTKPDTDQSSSFAKRLITGRAAERYFHSNWRSIPEFAEYCVEDTTDHGCGYDFRLWPQEGNAFKAVEVKGMAEESGTISLTEKEYSTAEELQCRFFLFVVKNFRDKPFHELHCNPLAGPLSFKRAERVVVQVSWCTAA